ncbi:MAG: hypothetical protein ACI89W_002053, partial [Gammaproteobacteria bacterium]
MKNPQARGLWVLVQCYEALQDVMQSNAITS